jgi:hypothetical protein
MGAVCTEDLKRIRTMVHLAIYDKNYGDKDRRIVSHYRNGYVSIKNMGTHIFVIFGFLILEVFKITYYMMFDEPVFMSMLTKDFLIKEGIKLLILLMIYSLICSIKYKKQYDRAQKRINGYERRLDKLCETYEEAERTQI